MHANLIVLAEKIKKQAKALKVVVKTSSMLGNESIIFSNEDSNKVVLVGVVEISGTLVTAAYSINPHKWSWAEKEGFSKAQITNNYELSSQIFREIKVDEILESLI
jgi:hypothetical protein